MSDPAMIGELFSIGRIARTSACPLDAARHGGPVGDASIDSYEAARRLGGESSMKAQVGENLEMALPNLRVFVSSPGDAGLERIVAGRVIERLQGEFGHAVTLAPILWEAEPLRATEHFQSQITPPSATDIFVCILWSRLGTRLPPDQFRRPDGTPYASGTEWELEDAAQSYRARGVPDLLVYRKMSEPLVSLNDESEIAARLAQKKMLDGFLEHWFFYPDGSFKAAYHTFLTPDQFEEMLAVHLRKLVQRRLPEHPVTAIAPSAWHQEPFRGLETFDLKHAKIFFGRMQAIGAVKDALIRQAAAGRAFVVVFGMSGCGKSSLIRAGVLAALLEPGVIEGIDLWRYCIFRPSDAPADLLEGLARALVAPGALPELEPGGFDAASLAAHFRSAATGAAAPIRMGLVRAAEVEQSRAGYPRRPEARLLLVVDQLEELFTLERETPARRENFIAVVSALACSGVVWVLAAMRSDFYPHCAELPELARLKSGAGQFDLLPPSVAQISQIIRYPALAAGVRFEQDPRTGQTLDDILHEAGSKDPEALPLLEFTLDELYKQRTGDAVLTFAAYEDLGGLGGALARRAEEVFTQLGLQVRASLPGLVRALVTIGPGSDVVTARRVRRSLLDVDPARNHLIDALIDARLMVSDRDTDGQAIVGIAHEALLNNWPRVRASLEADREFLRARARAADSAARWRLEGRRADFLLPVGKPLSEAEDLLGRRRPDLDPETIDYITASTRAYRKKRRAARTFATVLGSAFFAVVAGFGAFSFVQWRFAKDREQTAISLNENLRRIDKGRIQALAQSSVIALDQAISFCEQGNVANGLLWMVHALEVAPQDHTDLQYALRANLLAWRSQIAWEPAIFRAATQGQHFVAFLPDGKAIASLGYDGAFRFWDARTGEPSGGPLSDQQVVRAALSPDGRTVATEGKDRSVQFWDVATRVARGKRLTGQFLRLPEAFNRDGTRAVSVDNEGTVHLWDTANAAAVGEPLPHTEPITTLVFSRDGARLLAGEKGGKAYLWDARAGRLIGSALEHGSTIVAATFTIDGKTALLSGPGGTIRRWEAETARPLDLPPPPERGDKRILTFSPDASACLSFERGQLRIESVKHREGRVEVGYPSDEIEHRLPVRCYAFSPDGRILATGSGVATTQLHFGLGSGEVRIWDVASRRPIGGPMLCKHEVLGIAFSPDGRMLAAATGNTQTNLIQRYVDGKPVPEGHGAGELRLWQLAEGTPNGRAFPAFPVDAADWSPDGEKLLVLSEGTARVWNVQTAEPGRARAILSDHARPTVSPVPGDFVRFSSKGRAFLTVALTQGADGAIRSKVAAWETASGHPIGEPATLAGAALALAPESDKALVIERQFPVNEEYKEFNNPDVTAIEGKFGAFKLLNWKTGAVVIPPTKLSFTPVAAAFSPDESVFVIAGDRSGGRSALACAQCISATTGAQRWSHEYPDSTALALAFSEDGFVLLASLRDLRVLDLRSGREVVKPVEELAGMPSTAFCPDRRSLVVSTGKAVRFWDLGTLQPIGPPIEQDKFAGNNDGTFAYPRPGGESVLAGTNYHADRTSRLYERPRAVEAKTEEIALAVEVLTGMTLGADGRMRGLQVADWLDRRARLKPMLDQSGGIRRLLEAESPAEWHREQADESHAKGNWFAMEWHLDRLIAAESASASLLARRGEARRRLGRDGEALADYTRASELEPSVASHRYWQSFVLNELQRYADAVAAATQAIALDTQNPRGYVERAYAFRKGRDYMKAVADYGKAISKGEEGIASLIARGDCLAELAQWPAALDDFKAATEARRSEFWSESLRQRGFIRQRKALLAIVTGDHAGYRRLAEETLDTLRYTAPIDDLDAEAHAWVCVYAPDALDDLAQFAVLVLGEKPNPGWYLKLAPEGARVSLIGAILFRAGRHEESVKILQEAVNQPPQQVTTDYLFLAMALQKLGRTVEAKEILSRALKRADSSTKTIDVQWPWNRKLAFRLLREEAEALISK
jgi:WD40 repeat protein/tetratricopeptide (TPR) repeat protein